MTRVSNGCVRDRIDLKGNVWSTARKTCYVDVEQQGAMGVLRTGGVGSTRSLDDVTKETMANGTGISIECFFLYE